LADPATASVLDLCRELGVRVALCILEPRLPLVRDLCALAPDLPVALDHCGFADLTGDTAALDALADVANLRLKVTTTLLEPVLHAGLDPRDAVERLCERFGVERLMWGSDYPQHHNEPHGAPWGSRSDAATARRRPGNSEPYAEIVDLGRHACSRLSPAEQARFLGGTALEIWPELTPHA
jgi:predicted TIM-barrel fold metal-dependent hydrolase